MPEGDTVWLTARRLDQALRDRVLTVGELRVPQLATAELRGDTVTAVIARGKHLLTRLGSGRTLHSHLRMDGSWYLTRAGVRPRRHPEHMIRARLGNAEWLATGYRVHDLRLVRTKEEAQLVGHLGPDLLGPDWDADRAVANLRGRPDRAIGDALLDQRVLAGIGNLYKCETLFVRRVNPWTPVGDVPDLPALVAAAYRLLRANRDHPEQSTTGQTRRGEEHWVYQRTGEACRRCGTPITAAAQGDPPYARTTWWCPRCQQPPSA
jgi:endonuclease VIII